MNSFCAWYSFRMSFWSVPPRRARSTPDRSGGRDVHREHDRGGRVDRHRRRDRAEVDARVEVLDVGERVDRDAALADLAERERIVGVAPHQRREVERGREPVATRRRAGRGSDGSCRARCRSPRTSASSRASTGTSTRTGPRVYGYCAGVLAVVGLAIGRAVHRLDRDARQRLEVGVALRRRVVRPLPALSRVFVAHQLQATGVLVRSAP